MTTPLQANKKLLAIKRYSIVALATALVITPLLSGCGQASTSYVLDTNNGETTEINNTGFAKNDFRIDRVENVSVTETPIYYDFIIGSIGLNEDIVPMVESTWRTIFMTKKDSSKFYVARKIGNEGDGRIELYLPRFSSDPQYYYVKDEDNLSQLTSYLESHAEKHEEGDKIFYVLNYTYEDIPGMDLVDLMNKTEIGTLERSINSGQGYPTTVLRKAADLETIKERYHYDFTDPFWDTFNYKSRIKCYKLNSDGEKMDYVVLEPVTMELVADSDVYINTVLVNGYYYNQDADAVNTMLIEKGYESIEQALSNGIYASEEETKNHTGLHY